MTLKEFISKLKKAQSSKTLYVLGGWGAPLTDSNKTRFINKNSFNKNRSDMINAATDDTWACDCVCLIKSIIWGWSADKTKTNGGAIYGNGMPDWGADGIFTRKYVYGISKDFSQIQPGAVVHMSGHVGVYVGCGQVIECTPKWKNCVQISYLGNNPEYKKGNYRVWDEYGYLPCVDYTDGIKETPIKEKDKPEEKAKTIHTVVRGDNLTKIAYKYDTTIEKIIEDNIKKYPRITRNYICVGWKLEV